MASVDEKKQSLRDTWIASSSPADGTLFKHLSVIPDGTLSLFFHDMCLIEYHNGDLICGAKAKPYGQELLKNIGYKSNCDTEYPMFYWFPLIKKGKYAFDWARFKSIFRLPEEFVKLVESELESKRTS